MCPAFALPDQDPAGPAGPVPPDNQPGHHPPVEQDKPFGRRAARLAPHIQRFPFRFDRLLRLPAWLLGVGPGSASVDLGPEELVIRYGRWSLATPLANVVGAERSGPYHPLKVVGPPRLSLADQGITFAPSTGPGVCIRFAEPVAALLPFGWIRHPGATVAVEDPDALLAALDEARARQGAGAR